MRPTVFLFDVDGTLVTTGGVGRRAIVATFERLSIVAQPSFSFAGMTDRGIVRQALEEAGADVTVVTYGAMVHKVVEAIRTSGSDVHRGSFPNRV